MNLITDPWIPALRHDGSLGLFGLQEVFQQAEKLRDLAVKPHERVALMRLLICITQAALEGPEDPDEWTACVVSIQPKAVEYLLRWKPSFELLGDGPRFLQVPNLEPGSDTDEGNALSKLDMALATGNNSTLFDTQAGDARVVSVGRSALNLLTFQCFAPGGRIGVAKWNGRDTAGKGSSSHAPCTPSSMLHSFLLGETLLKTLHLNILSRQMVSDVYGAQSWGKPIWELPVTDSSVQELVKNATMTYLGRLVPLSRAVRLKEDGATIILGNGLDYPIFPNFREASATIIKRKDELVLLPSSTSRSLWRQLASITVKRIGAGDATSGPLALANLAGSDDQVVWVGALVTDKAKIEDVVESKFDLPAGMFDEFGRAAYERGVHHAEIQESALIQAVKAYAASLKVVAPAYDRARQYFWTRAEQHLSSLFILARNPDLVADLGSSAWGKAVQSSAREAFEQCCPRQNARQIQAFASALRKLSPPANRPSLALVTHE